MSSCNWTYSRRGVRRRRWLAPEQQHRVLLGSLLSVQLSERDLKGSKAPSAKAGGAISIRIGEKLPGSGRSVCVGIVLLLSCLPPLHSLLVTDDVAPDVGLSRPAGVGWVSSHSARAVTVGSILFLSHQAASSPHRWISRWCPRHTGTVNSSLTFLARARLCANRRWWASDGRRPQTRQPCGQRI